MNPSLVYRKKKIREKNCENYCTLLYIYIQWKCKRIWKKLLNYNRDENFINYNSKIWVIIHKMFTSLQKLSFWKIFYAELGILDVLSKNPNEFE